MMPDADPAGEPGDQYDPEVAERTLAFAAAVDHLALLLAGEDDEEKIAAVLRAVRGDLELSEEVLDLFIEAILRRKAELERSAVPVQCQ